MNGNLPQSWNDLPLITPNDPRDVLSYVALDDNTGAPVAGRFTYSTTWLRNIAWAASPLSLSPYTGTTIPIAAPVNAADFDLAYQVTQWNNTHAMVRSNTQLPPTVQRMVFVVSNPGIYDILYLDWAGGVTSTDIQISLRENSALSGDFTNTTAGTIPVYNFTGTFGGTGRKLQMIIPRPGRFSLCIRVVDNTGNWSMFEIEVIAI